MIKKIMAALALLFPVLAFSNNSDQAIKDRMKSDLDSIRNVFDVAYAPSIWKGSYYGWDLDDEIQKAKDKIQRSKRITTKQYQRIVAEFFQSPKDYHVGVFFFSTEKATLPFTVKTAQGRFFISHVDTSKLSPGIYPLNVGDELVVFDNMPIQDVMKEIVEQNTKHANPATDLAMASYYLTHRSGVFGHVVPKGAVTVGVMSPGGGTIRHMKMMWDYAPEKISNGFLGSAKPEDKKDKQPKTLFSKHKKLHDVMMIMPQYQLLNQIFHLEEEDDFIGSKNSFVPTLGSRIWWEAPEGSAFNAYIYETDDHKLVGYIRIPHYSGWNFDVAQFSNIINLFQSRTDALVIDQVNNPGGNLFYMYGLLSTLTDKPLIVPKHRMAITQEMVASAVEELAELEKITSDSEAVAMIGPDLIGIPVTYQFVQFYKDYLNFIISQWNEGRKLTDPFHILAIDQILPCPYGRYTKPILLLTNSLDISCGDFFPAILQDNKRVTILGTQTAGAGGYVMSTEFPNRFGIQHFSYTASIAQRIDNKPIENLGVKPDIEYEITPDDIQFGYSGYGTAIDKAVHDLLNPKFDPIVIPPPPVEDSEDPNMDKDSED